MSDKAKAIMLGGLIEAIDKWSGEVCEEDYWAEAGMIPTDLTVLMARAALLVLEVNAAADKCERS